jgi:hypothetical protein
MSLEQTRQALNEVLLSGKVSFKAADGWRQVKDLANEWQKLLKEWESKDTFEAAYQQKRMTARAMADNRGDKVGEFKAPQAGKPRSAETDRDIKLAYGAAGVQARMKPTNLFVAGQESKKNDLGLHDLSATLLTPDREWTKQLKHYEDAAYLLMPMPQEEDLMLYYQLHGETKGRGVDPAFRTFMRQISSRMTRLKYASAEDMHTTYVDNAPIVKVAIQQKAVQNFAIFEKERVTPGKFRYGITGTSASKEDDEAAKSQVDVDEVKLRRARALRYKQILSANEGAPVNEIVVAYRSHGTSGKSNFPMYARLDKERTSWLVVDDKGKPLGITIKSNGQMVKDAAK